MYTYTSLFSLISYSKGSDICINSNKFGESSNWGNGKKKISWQD